MTGSAKPFPDVRVTAASNRLLSPISGANCFGRLFRDSGHNLDPTPPHNITGTILLIAAPLCAFPNPRVGIAGLGYHAKRMRLIKGRNLDTL
jgi:hypothetical protein